MTIKGNTLKDLRDYFYVKLNGYFPDSEIQAMFYILLEDLLGISKNEYFIHSQKRISESEIVKFVYAIKDLKNAKPLSYITQKHIFCELPLYVNENVLIPRPETEELVHYIVSQYKTKKELNIYDICTGSGCIALALKSLLPQAKVIASDVSVNALKVARKNAQANHLQVDFFEDDLLHSQLNFNEVFDIVVSNPPYIPENEKSAMDKNVVEYEPGIALFVPNENPLLFYDEIAQKAGKWLKTGGMLAMEIHENYGNEVVELLKTKNYSDIELHKDLNGKNRFVTCVKK